VDWNCGNAAAGMVWDKVGTLPQSNQFSILNSRGGRQRERGPKGEGDT